MNHDGFGDIVGFGAAGTFVAYGNGDGSFASASFDTANFSQAQAQAQGWTSDATYHRELADINHDGLRDVVGFGQAGVRAGLNQGDLLVATPSTQALLSPALSGASGLTTPVATNTASAGASGGPTQTTDPPPNPPVFAQAMVSLGTVDLASSLSLGWEPCGDIARALVRPA